MTTETIQTIYTLISHAEGKCSGCLNVTYEAGDDQIKIFCNQCGAIPAAQPAPQSDSLYVSGVKFLRAALEECAKGKTVTFTADHLQTLTAVFESWSAQPAPGWISASRTPEDGCYEVVVAHTGKEEYIDGACYNSDQEPEWTLASDPYQVMMDLEVTRYRKFGPLPAPPEPAQGKDKA